MHNINMDETIIVSSIIDKLPTSWKDFKHSLKHKKEDLSFEELANSLRIEEEFHNKRSDRRVGRGPHHRIGWERVSWIRVPHWKSDERVLGL